MEKQGQRIWANADSMRVTVSALPGCITQGDDIDEAIAMAKEAIELYIEELKERGDEIPDDSNMFEYSLNLVA